MEPEGKVLRKTPLAVEPIKLPPVEASHQRINPLVVNPIKLVLLPQLKVAGNAETEPGGGKSVTFTVSAILAETQELRYASA